MPALFAPLQSAIAEQPHAHSNSLTYSITIIYLRIIYLFTHLISNKSKSRITNAKNPPANFSLGLVIKSIMYTPPFSPTNDQFNKEIYLAHLEKLSSQHNRPQQQIFVFVSYTWN